MQNSTVSKTRIMVFCDFYLPSKQSGGGMWTVVNLVSRFCDRFDFFIVTRNYDSKSDKQPYNSVRTGEWNDVDGAKVYYATPRSLTRFKAAALVNEVCPDLVFLNSVLSLPVLKYLFARRQNLVPRIPMIVAPCGELSPAALGLKPLKKKAFLSFAKAVGLFGNAIWKATNEVEKQEIFDYAGTAIEIFCAPDLAPEMVYPDYDQDLKPPKSSGMAKFSFLSRLTRKKNLHYFLERLRAIDKGRVEVDVIGPLEDRAYYKECMAIANELTDTISVRFLGPFSNQEALTRVLESHFFVLPTLNENFGYVMLEGLAVGCPLLISDKTIWSEIVAENAGWAIPLENTAEWIEAINCCIAMDQEEYRRMSERAVRFANAWISDPSAEMAMADIIDYALVKNLVNEPRVTFA